MATKADFEPFEWQLLMSSPRLIYFILTEGSDMFKTEEKGLSDILEHYETDNHIIQDVLTTKGKVFSHGMEPKKGIPYDLALKNLEQIGDVLEWKVSPEEAEEFRDFLLAVAQKIAQAAGEGILGLGKKVSAKEEQKLKAITVALKATEEDKQRRAQERGGEERFEERFYEVKPGDSLSKIAAEVYGNASEWRKIFEANKNQIENPDLIHPGQKFRIP